jgi:serine/threonine protein phosphatase 1
MGFMEKNNTEQWIAIGDIHACPQQLNSLLKKIKGFPNHRLIFLGDYVDYGDDLSGLIELLRKIQMERKDTIFLLGNHDEELLSLYRKFCNEEDKFQKILEYYKVSQNQVEWMDKNLLTYFETENAFFSHAGLDDTKDLQEQTKEDLIHSGYREELDHITPKLVVQGHLVMKEVKSVGNHWFVDTGCGWGGKLSCLVYPEMEIVSV